MAFLGLHSNMTLCSKIEYQLSPLTRYCFHLYDLIHLQQSRICNGSLRANAACGYIGTYFSPTLHETCLFNLSTKLVCCRTLLFFSVSLVYTTYLL